MNGALACRAVLDYGLFLAGSEYIASLCNAGNSFHQTSRPPSLHSGGWNMGIYYYDIFCNEIAVSVASFVEPRKLLKCNIIPSISSTSALWYLRADSLTGKGVSGVLLLCNAFNLCRSFRVRSNVSRLNVEAECNWYLCPFLHWLVSKYN